ncbi:MAG TPA: hypothetical protein VN325_31375 [Steroidobacteraceae bacterium]|nr:hypothetical protein [Steroidobacteraceae bacterium]
MRPGPVTTAHRIAVAILAALGLQSLPACAVLADSPGTPAVIADATAESRVELARVIHEALGDVPVTLADDALTGGSLLSLEHALRRDPMGRPLNGRELTHPETFELFKRGPRCVLVQSRTGREWTLHHVQCVAAPVQAPQ